MRGSMENIHSSVFERADEGLLRLLEKANIAALTDKEIDYYEANMKRLEDEMDMEEHGYERGKEEERIKIARNLKMQGVDSNTISIATGLPIEKIEKL